MYTAAIVLVPLKKWTYFDANLPLGEVVTAKEQATRPKTGLQKWRQQKQKQAPTIDNYIALSAMALDIPSIPAIEAEPESLFSSAKTTTTDKRKRMNAETLKALESLKSWLGGHFTALLGTITILQ